MPRRALLLVALCACLALVAGACGDSSDPAGPSSSPPIDDVVAQVASYELVANQDQRFLAALAGNGDGLVVSFGSARLQFSYLGTRDKPIDPPEPRSTATANFIPVTGQPAPSASAQPRMARPSEGVGVYAAEPVRFDAAGYWGVTIEAKLDDGRTVADTVPFEVYAETRVPAPGQPAPRTDNPVAGAAGVDPASIDSRASATQPVPDAVLHTTSVTAALDARKPLVVVVSTPVFCQSQFCGPITDMVERLAGTYGDRVAFVHIEVWQDFAKKIVNPSASAWIAPKTGVGDTQEPWVFVVGSDGIIKQRFDNVVNDAALETAVRALVP